MIYSFSLKKNGQRSASYQDGITSHYLSCQAVRQLLPTNDVAWNTRNTTLVSAPRRKCDNAQRTSRKLMFTVSVTLDTGTSLLLCSETRQSLDHIHGVLKRLQIILFRLNTFHLHEVLGFCLRCLDDLNSAIFSSQFNWIVDILELLKYCNADLKEAWSW